MDLPDLKNIPKKDGLTVKEAVRILAEEEESELNVREIFITPPEVNDLTDEDSGDEDGGMIDNLTGGQLRAEAEIRLTSNKRIGINYNFESGKMLKQRTWIGGDMEHCTRSFSQVPDYAAYSKLSSVELFELFVDNELIEHLVSESAKYASFINYPNPNITCEEMKAFIGILVVSGYNILPGKKYYWDMRKDVHNELVSNAMRRDRFIQIMRFLHISDNTKIDKSDKYYKVRPMIEKIKNKCLQHFVPYEYLNYEESMIKYYGRHSCKQFIRGKPIRFGYKAWCLNTDFGYLVNFDLYQGKNPSGSSVYEAEFGKAAAPLLKMLDEMPVKNLPYNLFFDNLCTGMALLGHLKKCGFHGTGTIRENRIPKDCPLPLKQNTKKEERGSHFSSFAKEDGISIIKWMDNSLVMLASTTYGVAPTSSLKRFSKKQNKIVQIPQPHAISQYNKHMGGTDRMDEDINALRIGIRGRKWWWTVFTWLLDVAVNNAWMLKKKTSESRTRVEFRREIAQVYLLRYKTPVKSPGGQMSRVSTSVGGSTETIRYDKMAHFITEIPGKKRRRCAFEDCSSRGRTMCDKCDVGLCVKCFKRYHLK